MAAERTLDDCRHALNQFFRGEAVERWIFTHNCTDGLNLAIKGTVKPGDHVITSDLEHNSVSRPLRRLEKDGVITLTRLASHQGYLDPEDVRRRPVAEDLAGRPDARVERARDGPADRGHRAHRPRGRCPVSGRRRAVGRHRANRPEGDANRPARLPRPQGPLRPDRHRRPLRRPPREARSLARGWHRRRLVERDPASTASLLPRRRDAQRPGRRRPGRRPGVGRRARGGCGPGA